MEVIMNKKMGYARVSSKEQHLDRQIMALQRYVTEDQIIIDKQSGKDLDRPGYTALKGALGLRSGDTLYITSLDRLSRNKEDIQNELKWFRDNDIRLIVLDLPTTAIEVPEGQEWIIEMVNNILIEVLSSIAQQERETIRKRQREGINAAKAAGKHLGAPDKGYPKDWALWYERYSRRELTRKYVIEQLGISEDRFTYLKRKFIREKSGRA